MFENFIQYIKNTSILLISTIVIIFSYFYIVSSNHPLSHDDYGFTNTQFIIEPFDYNKFTEISHQINWRKNFNARLGESVTVIFTAFNKIYYDVFISIVNLLFILLAFFYTNKRFPSLTKNTAQDSIILAIIFSLYIIINSYMLASSIWLAGALNHLFGNVLLLFLFIPYYCLFFGENKFQNKYFLVLIWLILSYAFAFNSEISVMLYITISFIAILFNYIKNKKIYIWSLLGFVLTATGFINMMFYAKDSDRVVAYYSTNNNLSVINKISIVINKSVSEFKIGITKIIYYTDSIVFNIFYIIFIVLILFMIIKIFKKNLFKINSNFLINFFIFFILLILSSLFIAISPVITHRVLTMNMFFTIVCVTSFLLFTIKHFNKNLVYFILLLFMVFNLKSFFDIYYQAKVFDFASNERAIYLLTQENDSNLTHICYDPTIPSIVKDVKSETQPFGNADTNDWAINILKSYYKITKDLVICK